jgi:hypothetical protein
MTEGDGSLAQDLIGLVAVGLLFAAGCGYDDDATADGQGGGLFNQDEGSSDGGDGGGGGGSGYSQEMQDNLMGTCTGQSGATEDACRCMLDAIMANVPFEDYTVWEQAILEDPAAQPPQGYVDAIMGCTA